MRGMSVLLALALVGCATTYGGATPRPVDGDPDSFRFKVYTQYGVGQDTAFSALKPEIESFKTSRGYGQYKVTEKLFDGNGYDYTVKFAK